MCSPTTPMRPQAGGAGLSSPFSSYCGETPPQLTPRSKVKALLAAVDDESDSEDCLGVQDHHTISSKPNGTSNLFQATKIGVLCEHSGNEGDESEDAPIMSRGRLVARLHGRSATLINRQTAVSESSDGNPHATSNNRDLLTGPTVKPEEQSFLQDGLMMSTIHNRQRRSASISSQSPTKSAIGSRTSSPSQEMASKLTSFAGLHRSVTSENDSDSDLPPDPQISNKLQLLVARKKEARRAKEQAEAQEKVIKRAELKKISQPRPSRGDSMTDISDSDEANERKLTQQSRPTRKASKKALEEMNRETQRMSRNMQLAHQARTRKKITKESFFSRFNFRASPHVADATQAVNSSTAGSSVPASDMEGIDRDSPPTTPDRQTDSPQKSLEPSRVSDGDDRVLRSKDVEQVLPSGFSILDTPLTPLHELNNPSKKTTINQGRLKKPPRPQTRLSSFKCALPPMTEVFRSDSELEILPVKKPNRSKVDVFDRLPAQNQNLNEERSLQTLRALAHMHSPGKQNRSKSSMTMSDMQTLLQVRARKQAAEERAEKIRDLRDRGILIQTAEERERDQAEIEDLVEKARREAAEITQREKEATRKERLANGELCGADLTSDEDEDYQGNDADESDLDLSGSDEEQVNNDENRTDSGGEETEGSEEDEEGGVKVVGDDSRARLLIDAESSEAEEAEEAEEQIQEEESDSGDGEDQYHEVAHIVRAKRKRTAHLSIDDDDEEDEKRVFHAEQALGSGVDHTQKPLIPGLPFSNAMPMGITQAFAATMAEPQTNMENADPDEEQLAFLGPMPEPNFQMYDLEESHQIVPDSQNGNPQAVFDCGVDETISPENGIHFSQGQTHYGALDGTPATQDFEIPDPTQDAGFSNTSPIRNRFVSVPPSTVDTILLSGLVRSSPNLKKKGRLRRRAEVSDGLSHTNENVSPCGDIADSNASINVFEVMKKAAGKPAALIDVFEKNKSVAKGMVDEQAEESEDEYAGLGGASDDENGGEENEEDRKMIDEGEVHVDESKIAAYYADKERANDEKVVERLFKDINKGMLRRKRGAEFNLSDSDDDREARQRAKRREFAKMRKALLENENVGKIADDPKKLAFLRAIEDRENDSLNFLEHPEDPNQMDLNPQEAGDSQPQTPSEPPTTSVSVTQKRPLQDSFSNNGNRLPPSARGTRPFKKPSTLADIRESVSFLIEEPDVWSHRLQPSSSPLSSENEAHDSRRGTFASRRRSNPIIDRISIKRAASSSKASTNSRFAFQDPSSGAAMGGFRVPSLLRRATTSQLSKGSADQHGISVSTAGTERAAGGGEKGDFIKRGGSRKSSIGYFASRERERGAGLKDVERRRSDGLRNIGRSRVGLRGLSGGSFD